ncbi:hypothetical protein [Arthrobacter sp. SX1312]|uniref:hypothetical protein n=1 Tax=Arthrobacter sp. SX1312 TaxID=2058896 RepID=UPI0015E1F2A0|nr:hypothetical protein [Arthrobacter sp. SX1312]
MHATINRTAALNIALTLALAAAAVMYLSTAGVNHSVNTLSALVVAVSAIVLSHNLWK